jgi:NAD(P)-dependent dehydrogenase (short-subunit alcohol dehydrogenase family)
MASQIVLILGAGPNIGASVAQSFSSKGYKVAAASRNIKPDYSAPTDLTLQADFTDPSSISTVFSTTKSKLGVPNVIIYNVAAVGNMDFAGTPKELHDSLAVNAVSLYAAIQEAVAGFETLPKELSKTFIYTGNKLNIEPYAMFAMLGTGKAAGAHLIQAAGQKYDGEGYKFYYTDERKADGGMAGMDTNAKAHGEFYLKLAEQEKDVKEVPLMATFVDGKGYVDFSAK